MLVFSYKKLTKVVKRKVVKMTNTNEKKIAHCDKHNLDFTGICGSCIGEFGYFD